MNLGQFHTLVSSTLNRGTTLDSKIPTMVKLAVAWIERNYTMKHMERFKLLQVKEGDRTINLPTNSILKGIKFVRFIGDDGLYAYPNKIEPEDATGVGQQTPGTAKEAGFLPSSYWVVGHSALVFSSVPAQDISGEAMWYEFTDWPETNNNTTHYILSACADVLLAQTLLNMAAFHLRDPRMVEGYKMMRDEGLSTLTRTEDEQKYSGESQEMQYRPV